MHFVGRDHFIKIASRGGEDRQLATLITQRSQVQIPSPQRISGSVPNWEPSLKCFTRPNTKKSLPSTSVDPS